MTQDLAQTVEDKRLHITAALAARYSDLDLAEDAFAEACLRAAGQQGEVSDWAAWLFTTANRIALDRIRHRKVVSDHAASTRIANEEEVRMQTPTSIPDHRLALIFACCHPAIDIVSRVALALSTVCGLTIEQVAKATVMSAAAVSQRLLRAKRKLAGAGIVFEIPDPRFYSDRLEAVLTTVEIAYSKAHASSASDGEDALLARQVLDLANLLVEMLPDEPEVRALAASTHFSEARRPARIDAKGVMVPLAEQDPAMWDGELLAAAQRHRAAIGLDSDLSPRLVQLELQHAWCSRRSERDAVPWRRILTLYDRLIELDGDNSFARLNRLVALERLEGAAPALAEFERLPTVLSGNPAYHAVHARLLAESERIPEALSAYDAAISAQSSPPERRWLEAKRRALAGDPRTN